MPRSSPPADRCRGLGRARGILGLGVLAVVAVAASVTVVLGRADLSRSDPSPASPAGSGRCRINEIPRPAGLDDLRVVAGDPAGSFIVVSLYRDLTNKAFLLHNGDSRPLPIDADMPIDVNSAGTVVGTVGEYQGGPRASGWVFEGGQQRGLSGLGGDYHTAATAINERGDIVGWSSSNRLAPQITRDEITHRPVLWPAGSWPRQPRELKVPDGRQGIAYGIDDDGTAVGQILWWEGEQEHSRAYVWGPDGTGRDLPIAGYTQAYSIRDGWAIGSVVKGTTSTAGNIRAAILWNLRDGSSQTLPTSLGVAPGPGRAVGKGGLVIGQTDQGEGFLRRDTELILLPRLDPAHAGVPVLVADDGTVIGHTARATDSKGIPVRWHC